MEGKVFEYRGSAVKEGEDGDMIKGGNDNGLNGPALKMISHPVREATARREVLNAIQCPTIDAK